MSGQLPARSEWARRAQGLFMRSLEASGATRGFRAATKKDEKVGELYIYDEIGENFWTGEGVTAKSVQRSLDGMKGVDTLNVYINSPGGSVFEGKAILAQLERFDAQKVVRIDGIAASAASFIAMAGNKIITNHAATWMIHRAAGGAWGFADDLRQTADVLDMLTDDIAGVYAARTKRSKDDVMKWMGEETWMNAEQALERGFTDEVQAPPAQADEPPAAAARSSLVAAVEMTAKQLQEMSSPHVKAALARERAKELRDRRNCPAGTR